MKQKLPLLIYFLLSVISVYAGDTLTIRADKDDNFLLGGYLQILEDPGRNLSIYEVSSAENHDRFIPHSSSSSFAYIKNTESAYWIRFSIKADSMMDKPWVLENMDPHIDKFELYVKDLNSGKFKMQQAGYASPFRFRDYPHKNFIFNIPVDTNLRTFYIRVSSRIHNPFLLKIRSTNYFAFYSLNEYYLLGMFYGILGIMAIYNLLVYFSMKERLYLLYVIYVICCAIISLAEDGLGFQYLWPEFPEFNRFISIFSPLILMIPFTIYSKAFLELRSNLPKINQILNYVIIGYTIFFLLDKSFFKVNWDLPIYLVPFAIIYLASIQCLRKGYRQARYYVLGYSFMFISIIFLIFRMSGLIHWDDLFTVYSFNIGLVFEIVILSFALADRIKIIKNEKEEAHKKIIEQLQVNEKLKDKVNRELEIKVAERTKEIHSMNEELQQMNEKLKQQAEEITRMNLLLDADNRKLQSNVKELVKARVLMKDVDFNEFSKIFPDKNSCLRYLEELKWDNGYKCKKCNNSKWCQGKDIFSRRCTKCRYDESATAFTIFHRLKFPITKAFYMLFLVYANKGKITSLELSQILQLRQSTCWTFSKKVIEAMKERKKNPVEATNDADGWALLVLDPKNE
ncbi:MAG: 7TM diverse intracellular signaling domain-containing protein [Cytophagaceae bacterium]